MTWDNILAFWLGTVFMGTVYSLIRWRVRRRVVKVIHPKNYDDAPGMFPVALAASKVPVTQEDARSDIQVLTELLEKSTMADDRVEVQGVMTPRERRVLMEWMNTARPEVRPPRRTVDPMKSEWDDVPPGWLNKSEDPIIPRKD